MLTTTRERARKGIMHAALRRGMASVLAVGLAAGVTTAVAAPAAAATNSYTSGAFTVGDAGPSNPSPVTVTVPAGTGLLQSLVLTLNSPSHAHPGDMVFDLRSPSGVQVRIGCNDGRTTFSDGNTCNALTPFYGADPVGTWELYPNDTLAFADDPNTSYGGYTLTLVTAYGPAVAASPEDATTVSGTPVTFTSTATGEPAPSAQWQVDTGTGFTDIPGATSADHTVTPTLADAGNQYRVRYSNSVGTAVSEAATLTVLPLAPSVTVQPGDTTVDSGSNAQFSSDAAGDPAPTVQWQRAEPGSSTFTAILGATSDDLTVEAVDLSDDGAQFRAVYTSSAGTATSEAATLTVTLLAPSVNQDPADASVATGEEVSFAADASSEVAQTVQWQAAAPAGEFTDITGATDTTLTFTATYAMDGHRYRAVFTNPAGSTATGEATLTVAPQAPAVTSDPADLTVEEGQPATFTATTSGDPTATVQWQVSTDDGTTYTDILGANLTTFTIEATDRSQHLNLYRAVFTNLAGEATTTAAQLQVHHAPEITEQPADATTESGGSTTFVAAAVGTPDPTIQWQVSTDGGETFVDIVGAESGTLEVDEVMFADSGNVYRAVFTNSLGSITTLEAVLTVSAAAPVVVTEVTDQEVDEGDTVTFTAEATGDPTPTVQWRVSTDGGATFVDIAGATQVTYTFTATAADDGNQYVAVFTNAGGSQATSVATLTVEPTPVVVPPVDDTSSPALPVTGADVTMLALAGLLLVAAGAAAMAAARTRRATA